MLIFHRPVSDSELRQHGKARDVILDTHSEAGTNVLLVCSLQWPAWRLADAQYVLGILICILLCFSCRFSQCPLSAGEINS